MPRIGSKDFSVEFNDAVFETKAWQSSRYDGKELSGAQINKHTAGDVSFGKTPVIRNVTRNIYIGNLIINLNPETDNESNAIGDSTLTPFKNFSYITINQYFTVNDDDTISENNFDGSDLDSKRGFYDSFYEDFPIGGTTQIQFLDDSVPNLLNDNYTVYFNQGRLQKTIGYQNTNENQIGYLTGSGEFYRVFFSPGSIDGTFTIYNQPLVNEISPTSFKTLTSINTTTWQGFTNNLFAYKTGSFNTRRLFLTITSGSGSGGGLIPLQTNDDDRGNFPTKNLAEVSTVEINNFTSTQNRDMIFSPKFSLNQQYSKPLGGGASIDSADFGGSFYLSLLNDNIPSLLLYLQDTQYPQGTGNLPFIVIPSNLHPYIKDNLLYFLGQAGIDIGNRRIPNQLDGQNRKLT